MTIKSNTRVGDYVIERLLSDAGGMSSVYIARHQRFDDRKVAIKISASDNANAYQDLLRDEAKLLSKMRHPGLVRVFSQEINRRTMYASRAIQMPERPWYYVMELIPGETLKQAIKTRKISRLPLEWKVELFYQVVTTIDFMHKSGYAHCDLKPDNIIFRTTPKISEVPLPVLVDFGSASPVKQVKEKIATIHYASPEVIKALSVADSRSHVGIRADKLDIWQLGVLLYEIVTGEELFRGNSRRIKTTILQGSIKRMRDRRVDINPSLDRLVAVMLRPDPSTRPTTGQVIQALEERIAGMRPPRIVLGSY